MRALLGLLWVVLVVLWAWSVRPYPTGVPERQWDTGRSVELMGYFPLYIAPLYLLMLGKRRETA